MTSKWDKDAWAAELIVRDAPREFIEHLLRLDGTTMGKFATDDGSYPESLYGLGLIEGAPSSYMTGPGFNWLTPLGQKVVDRLKSTT